MTTDELRGLLTRYLTEMLLYHDTTQTIHLERGEAIEQQIVAAFEELTAENDLLEHTDVLKEAAFDSICHILGITEKSSRDEIESAIYKLKDALDIEVKRVKIHHDDWQRYKAEAERLQQQIAEMPDKEAYAKVLASLEQQLSDANSKLAELETRVISLSNELAKSCVHSFSAGECERCGYLKDV